MSSARFQVLATEANNTTVSVDNFDESNSASNSQNERKGVTIAQDVRVEIINQGLFLFVLLFSTFFLR